MKLTHWSAAPVTLAPRTYLQRADYKPSGLWFDVDEDWKRWCEGEEFGLERLEYRHTLAFTDDSGILRLASQEDLGRFTIEFAAESYPGQRRGKSWREWKSHCAIDWRLVAQRWDGIVIAPYIWASRLGLIWYYGWDCASGCVWNTEIISMDAPVVRDTSRSKNNASPAGR